MKNGLSLQLKITAVILLAAIVPLAGISVFAYIQAQNEIVNEEYEKLTAIRDLKKIQVEDWLDARFGDITTYAVMPHVLTMFNQFNSGFSAPGGLNSAAWKQAENEHGERINNYINTYGFRDFYFVSIEGNIIYSNKKEKDLGMNVHSTALAGSGMYQAYLKGQSATTFIDFTWYDVLNMPAAFFGTPIREIDGTVAGILVFRFAGAAIEGILNNAAGQGETGETFLVGPNYLMRNNSRLNTSSESTMLKQQIKTAATEGAISGRTDVAQLTDYRGVTAITAFAPISMHGVTWGIVAKINADEAFVGVYALRNIAITVGIVVALVLTIIGILFARSIGQPVKRITDELNGSSEQIASASTQLSETSQNIADGATEQASSIEEITASIEELSSMARQSLENSRQVSSMTGEAASESERGYERMNAMLSGLEALNESSDEIKKIVSVIDSIAFQTNILALNAAVEAARVGEAGMGFAVVADEVKSLANKSAESAKETAGMIEQSLEKIDESLKMARDLAQVFQGILGSSRKVSEMSKEVELASEQQESGIDQISKAMTQLDQVVQTNAGAAEESASSAEELLAQSDGLRAMVVRLMKIVTGKELEAELRSAQAHTAAPAAAHGNGASAGYPHSGIAAHAPASRSQTKAAGAGGNGRAAAAGRGNGGGKTAGTAVKVRPEHLIPFESDEEFEKE